MHNICIYINVMCLSVGSVGVGVLVAVGLGMLSLDLCDVSSWDTEQLILVEKVGRIIYELMELEHEQVAAEEKRD